jgi:acyl-CoA thioesterase FadM
MQSRAQFGLQSRLEMAGYSVCSIAYIAIDLFTVGTSRKVLEKQVFSEGKQLLSEGQCAVAWVNSTTMNPACRPIHTRQVLHASLHTDKPT